MPAATSELMQQLETIRINPEEMFPEPLPVREAGDEITKTDGYVMNKTDGKEIEWQWPQLKGQFLIDRDETVRWANIECAREGLAGIGGFSSAEEITAAAQDLVRH
jgi:hypothetical protein